MGIEDGVDSDVLRLARAKWRYRGTSRPSFAAPTEPGQESVWDYPRPPRIEADTRRVVVRVGKQLLADSHLALRVLETASPPTFYLPPDDIDLGLLERAGGRSACEWKGEATYWDWVGTAEQRPEVGWSYPRPYAEFEPLRGYLAFYPGRLECWLGEIRVAPQPGGIYGGWVTPEIVGPIKGEPGTADW
jgi:uncharacterized protein (DUF427 family)